MTVQCFWDFCFSSRWWSKYVPRCAIKLQLWPTCAQKEPKMSPKWAKMGNMSPKWAQNEPQNEHKIETNRKTYLNAPKMLQNAPKRVPKCSQVGPKWAQNEPKMVPSWPKMPPSWPKMLPRRSQAPSRPPMSWKCCKIKAKSPRCSQDAIHMLPKLLKTGASEASGGLFWMTFLDIQNYHKYSTILVPVCPPDAYK